MQSELSNMAERTQYKRWLKVFAFVFPIIVVVGALVANWGMEERPGARAKVSLTPKQLKILREWASYEYVRINSSSSFQNLVKQIDVVGSGTNAPTEALDRLNTWTWRFLMAYSTGNWEDYKSFVMPVSRMKLTDQARQFVLSRLKKLELQASESTPTEELWKRWWTVWNSEKYDDALGGQAGYFQTDTLAEISIKESKHLIQMNSKQPSLSEIVEKEKDIGVFTSPASIVPKESFPKGKEQAWVVSKLLLGNDEDPYFPVYLLGYWSNVEARWVPMELAVAYSPKRQLGFLF